ncbi:MAG: cysteine--tRNA ligase [Candidatus Lloydbacteria bacterium RIFCSPHIGHO2_02_FULL_54_17]|uniref:Cysteine--tRNA ligase n=1 Tax=Candidatus Lloydbacteria bacterium RIFCSPHIGHO2_02_FULL_54_17 TaxID=1798664 RepID=A0A1G2DGT4_9BACT|nr:MAG: cysteine--tRNA ligase [Candidatus Lloydbacteria bacterium RIFCSPHIGHO2_01_FULL_54_11]OGZ12723.1 MAG: cysteine--tRNA ligase [Candidatus Lloydbacteria bacterium RIFCSPHIGHO2_02_FULL_54_17]OGZ13575.1 MAG: cysteine--tRNA ligase [Candidatus Lloydbacteria bacterium RIFCSPLOWO2_01_FULL_54_18]OGZ16236.1 MAG: cysteine--tRNA ligase [Candidatus Lloydbacteria bacterium RIFCSPLOWO2_02_FULL_54_12]
MTLKLYNTLTREIEEFTPLHPPRVGMYNCGPTVYNYAHIGNLRAYVFADVLRRTLEMNGYKVKQVINITDVGHLVSDQDEGEDKMVLGAKREGKSVEEIITLYSDAFYDDLELLNVKAAANRGKEDSFPRATRHIPEQKELIETLAKKGFTYQTSDGIYFDTAKFPDYGKFARLNVGGMRGGERVALGEKRNITDFALWKFSPEDGQKREQEWDSPLGIIRKGFPGWHVECSAMSRKYLGQPFDIHTGGVDHIPVHHQNEIAQSVAAYGVPLANVWMHSAHMTVDGEKMSKSLGNTYRLEDLAKKGISPLAFRYWLLTASYRTQVNFTWEALAGAQKAYDDLRENIYEVRKNLLQKDFPPFLPLPLAFPSLREDLNTADAIARLWTTVRDHKRAPNIIIEAAMGIDEVLGLKLLDYVPEKIKITPKLQKLLDEREVARSEKNWAESDRLRDETQKLGYQVSDTDGGQVLTPLT